MKKILPERILEWVILHFAEIMIGAILLGTLMAIYFSYK